MTEPPSRGILSATAFRPVRLVAALVLAAGSVACAPNTSESTADAAPPPPASLDASAPAAFDGRCSTSFKAPNRKPVRSRSGTLVPPHAIEAVACRYFAPEGGDSLPLAEATTISGGPGRLVDYLNALSESDAGAVSGDGDSSAGTCSLMNASVYRIVFFYSERRSVTINVFPTCAVAERDGIVRQLESVTTLRGYWQS